MTTHSLEVPVKHPCTLTRTTFFPVIMVFCSLAYYSISGCTGIVPEVSPSAPPADYVSSSVSGMPLPGTDGIPAPSGTECNLLVLDWAGFDGAGSYSFDDGQPSQIDHWADLKATGVHMTFYVCSDSGGSWGSTWRDALASGSEIGNHTTSHQALTSYADDAARQADVDTCATLIRTTLGQTGPCSFAYPFGDTGWKPFLTRKFLLARTVNSGTIQPLDSTDPLLLPVFQVASTSTEADFKAALTKSANEGSWVIFMFHSLLPGANWYAGVQSSSVTGSIESAKTNGRVWLDSVQNIGAYWMAQKLFAGLSPVSSGTGKSWTWTLPANFPAGRYLRVKVGGGILSQGGTDLAWNSHGFYEVALDAGRLDWRP